MRRLPRDHGLSIATFGLFFVFVCGQSVMGLLDYNSTQQEHGRQPVSYVQYLGSGDFIEAVFENWESEFLQMGALRRCSPPFSSRRARRNPESPMRSSPTRSPEQAKHRADAPWPVRKGGLALKLYENSLSIALLALFVVSFVLHAVGGRGRLQRGAGRARRTIRLRARVSAHTALLVRVVPELAERVPGDRGDGSALHLPAPARLPNPSPSPPLTRRRAHSGLGIRGLRADVLRSATGPVLIVPAPDGA